MADENQNPFWERREGETETAYNAFCVYRDLGITRTLRKAATAFYAQSEEHQNDTERAPNPAALRRFKEWSRTWLWVSRVEAFDAEEQRETMLRMKERRQKMRESHFAVGGLALQRATQRLQQMALDEELPLRSVPSLIRAGSELQRLALGEPTSIEDMRCTEQPEEEGGDLDVSKLSVEDQEELVRIAGLLEDDGTLPDDPVF